MFGPAGAPAVTRDTKPAMRSCFSVGEGAVSVDGPVQTIQPGPLAVNRKLIFLFWRTASKRDRKSTRLNSSHSQISYAVFCLKKKKRASLHGQARRSITRFILLT